MNPSKFFSKKEILRILEVIEKVEKNTSGEIRIHIENHCLGDEIKRSQDLFYILEMQNTVYKNGVLIYIALEDKKVAIIGDTGIDKVTIDNFWIDEVNKLLSYFKKSKYVEGLEIVIKSIGEKLEKFFPNNENFINELSDEISFYNN